MYVLAGFFKNPFRAKRTHMISSELGPPPPTPTLWARTTLEFRGRAVGGHELGPGIGYIPKTSEARAWIRGKKPQACLRKGPPVGGGKVFGTN